MTTITGHVGTDDRLREMAAADKQCDYEVAHLAEDSAAFALLHAVAIGAAGSWEARLLISYMNNYAKRWHPRWYA